MIDSLPPTLETLTLRINVVRLEIGGIVFDNRLWMPHLIHLIENANKKLLRLRRIGIEVIGRTWDEDADRWMWKEIEKECGRVGMEFGVHNAVVEGKTKVPYFVEQTKDWNPGLD